MEGGKARKGGRRRTCTEGGTLSTVLEVPRCVSHHVMLPTYHQFCAICEHNSASPVFHPTYLPPTNAQYTYIHPPCTKIICTRMYVHIKSKQAPSPRFPRTHAPTHIHEHPANQTFHSRKSKHAQASMTLGDMSHRGGRSAFALPCPFPFPE